jgi:hypothetical protein
MVEVLFLAEKEPECEFDDKPLREFICRPPGNTALWNTGKWKMMEVAENCVCDHSQQDIVVCGNVGSCGGVREQGRKG